MRTIKFRGKRVDTQEWTFGSLVECHNGRMGIVSMTKYCEDNGIEALIDEVLPETVGQYTGREDDDGSDIYDGDIIRDRYMNCYEVIYSDNTMSWVAHSKTPFENNIPMSVVRDCITIGNIHDTPALLKGGEE